MPLLVSHDDAQILQPALERGTTAEVPGRTGKAAHCSCPPEPTRQGRHAATRENLIAAVEAIRGDVEKAEKGNKAATSRVRKAMQDVKAIAQDIRKEMLELRDSGGTGGAG